VDTVTPVPCAAAPTRWPAAVSVLNASAVTGPDRPARVIGVFRASVYVAVDGEAGTVLPLLARDALPLPTGIRLGVTSHELTWPVEPGQQALVGRGRIDLGSMRVDVVRTWQPARVSVAGKGSRPAGLDAPSELRSLAASVVREPGYVRRLVGLGPGLTPAGDDALCGVLLALRAIGSPALGPVRVQVASNVGRTTSLSASLLRAASEGYAVPCVARLASALAAGDLCAAREALPEVLAIGHTSGVDTLAGVLGAIDAAGQRVIHALQPPPRTGVEVNTPADSGRYNLDRERGVNRGAGALAGVGR
jgi:hypothetical protein